MDAACISAAKGVPSHVALLLSLQKKLSSLLWVTQFNQNLADIWNGQKYQEFRRRLLSADPLNAARVCGLLESVTRGKWSRQIMKTNGEKLWLSGRSPLGRLVSDRLGFMWFDQALQKAPWIIGPEGKPLRLALRLYMEGD